MPNNPPTPKLQRDRSSLELEILHVEITKESKDLLKSLAAAKSLSVAGYVDRMIQRKRKRLKDLGFIQS